MDNKNNLISATATLGITDGWNISHSLPDLLWIGVRCESEEITQVVITSAEDTLVAAKLEPGPIQTLAHKDADGKWILNDPPPDPALELTKCQRYYKRFQGENYVPGAFFSKNSGVFLLPGIEMRANPAINFNCGIIFSNGSRVNLTSDNSTFRYISQDSAGMKIVVNYNGTDGCIGPAVLTDLTGFASAEL